MALLVIVTFPKYVFHEELLNNMSCQKNHSMNDCKPMAKCGHKKKILTENQFRKEIMEML